MSACGVRVFLAFILLSLNYLEGSNGTVCDDGKYQVEGDLGGEENWVCAGNPFPTGAFYLPAGSGSCTNTEHPDLPQCMQASLSYPEHPPSHGAYRLVPPQYGEYSYLPPQRWLNTLKMGGVAFLYYPCTSTEQVESLRDLAVTCLNKYVITPYAELSEDYPLAVVTWGCVYRLQWVNLVEVKDWLLARNVDYLSSWPENIMYDRALIKAAPVHNFASLCQEVEDSVSPKATVPSSGPAPGDLTNPPKSAPHPLTAPPPPCQSNASQQDSCNSHTFRILHRHQTGLTVLIVLLGVVLLGFILLLAFKVVTAWRRRRGHKNQRYKSVSRYFPFSYEKQAVEVVIPALGMPKNALAERQVLLNDSDEDEL